MGAAAHAGRGAVEMGGASVRETERLLDEAEASRSCLAFSDGPLAQCLRRRVRGGAVLSPHRGLFVRAATWQRLNPRERDLWSMRALGAVHDDWVFCGVSAAEAHGLWLSWKHAGTLYVALRHGVQGGRRHTPGIRWRRAPAEKYEVVDGIRVTTLDETTVDCMRTLAFPDALGIADCWLRLWSCGTGRAGLSDVVEQLARHRPGIARARKAAFYADGRSENGGESYARARVIELGYAVPDVQVGIPDPLEPWHVNRVDYLWVKKDGSRVIGELDGLAKYVDPAFMGGLDSERVRAKERLRESRLAVPGASVMRFSMDDVLDAGRFTRLLDRYGVPRREG